MVSSTGDHSIELGKSIAMVIQILCFFLVLALLWLRLWEEAG